MGITKLIIRKHTMNVRKRNGKIVEFSRAKLEAAITAAFQATGGVYATEDPSNAAYNIAPKLYNNIKVEDIADRIEESLMEDGYHAEAKAFILYRDERRRLRNAVVEEKSEEVNIDALNLYEDLSEIEHVFSDCDMNVVVNSIKETVTPTMTEVEVLDAAILTVKMMIEKDPQYSYLAAQILLWKIDKEVSPYCVTFDDYILANSSLDDRLRSFDLDALVANLDINRDNRFNYIGLQTLYDRYLQRNCNGVVVEKPQWFWMRVAMGLAINEDKKNECALEFYDVMSKHLFIPSTPTLFNAGTKHPQLSSCYLLTVDDDLDSIFKMIGDDAKLSKWAGGLGNDWTNVRAMGTKIKGTNGASQGIVPFLKVANDTAVAVNQGGKRKGAMCAYLETWHLDIEDFLELRKNTGDDRRRTHDMNTANWIPDLFMERVRDDGDWTLFCPSEAADLHELYGQEFKTLYQAYEVGKHNMKHKVVRAKDLWRKMLTMLFETGHPWICFKDPSNLRSMQDHCGVVHSSNLCTEILLNTSKEETAVCNLGSINLAKFDDLNSELLEDTVTTAVRMLDNVIDINYYPTPEAEKSNKRHRPIGLGMMGFQDMLYNKSLSYEDPEAQRLASEVTASISYYAIKASTALAKERGKYPSFPGSKWSKGDLPMDSTTGVEISLPIWVTVSRGIEKHGIRNSQLMAIAPTATIANIVGVTQSVEPTYTNLYVKSNLSGEFTVVNPHLVSDLKKLGTWNAVVLDDIKHYNGSVQNLSYIPATLKAKYKTAFELNPNCLIDCAAERQVFIDMGQSLNLYMADPNGKKLSDMYFRAWEKGLKTTYYLRSAAATQLEKSNLDVNAHGIQPEWMKTKSSSSHVEINRSCTIDEQDCEACQ